MSSVQRIKSRDHIPDLVYYRVVSLSTLLNTVFAIIFKSLTLY